jgi:hypothetical protein
MINPRHLRGDTSGSRRSDQQRIICAHRHRLWAKRFCGTFARMGNEWPTSFRQQQFFGQASRRTPGGNEHGSHEATPSALAAQNQRQSS